MSKNQGKCCITNFFFNFRLIFNKCLSGGVHVQDIFFDSNRKCVAMVTSNYGQKKMVTRKHNTSSPMALTHKTTWAWPKTFFTRLFWELKWGSGSSCSMLLSPCSRRLFTCPDLELSWISSVQILLVFDLPTWEKHRYVHEKSLHNQFRSDGLTEQGEAEICVSFNNELNQITSISL